MLGTEARGPAPDVVVFVDDQPEVLDSLRRLLRDEAFEVRTTTSPEEALRWVGEGRVDVLVADERMPGMRGTELLVRASERSPATVCVVLSGYAGGPAPGGVERLISKPWNDEALKTTLRQLLDERGRPREAAGPPDFEALCGKIPGPIHLSDADGTILWVNAAELELLGRGREEVVGRPRSEFHADTAAAEELARRLRSGAPVRAFPARLRRKDGKDVDVLIDAEPVREGALVQTRREPAGAVEDQKFRAIGRLSAGIAHEINTPVGYILSNLSTMRDYVDDLLGMVKAAEQAAERVRSGAAADEAFAAFDARRARADVDFIVRDIASALGDSRKGAERIRDLVLNLRDFAGEEAGSVRPTDLLGCLENALRIAWNELKYTAAIERDLEALPPVPCSAPRMEQVFLSLLLNAGQAVGKKGVIRLSSRVAGGEAVLRVGDSGAGRSPEELRRLFDPFEAPGGVGLCVARRIVEGLGGRIEARSEPGKGNEFAVILPVRRGPEDVRAET